MIIEASAAVNCMYTVLLAAYPFQRLFTVLVLHTHMRSRFRRDLQQFRFDQSVGG